MTDPTPGPASAATLIFCRRCACGTYTTDPPTPCTACGGLSLLAALTLKQEALHLAIQNHDQARMREISETMSGRTYGDFSRKKEEKE